MTYQIRHAVFRLVQAKWGRDATRVFGGHQVGGVTERYAGADRHAAAKVAKSWGEAGLGFLAAQAVLGHTINGATQGYTGIDYSSAAKVIAKIG